MRKELSRREREFLEYIDMGIASPTDLASAMGLSRSRISNIRKALEGKTVTFEPGVTAGRLEVDFHTYPTEFAIDLVATGEYTWREIAKITDFASISSAYRAVSEYQKKFPWIREVFGDEESVSGMLRSKEQQKLISAWDQLQRAHGIRLIPKRQLQIPQIDISHVETIVGRQMKGLVVRQLKELQHFVVQGAAVADRFENDHTARTRWFGEMEQLFGSRVIGTLCYDNNLLRVNVLNRPIIIVDWLSYVVRKHTSVQEKLEGQYSRMYTAITGENPNTEEQVGRSYHEMTLEEKIGVVECIEDETIGVLALFAPPGGSLIAVRQPPYFWQSSSDVSG